MSEESCPFCAAERWAVVIALSHFGTWSHLGATTSSSTDVYPSTATFSFRNATYRSPYLALRTTELADNVGHPLLALTPLDTELIGRYDVPPYVNNVDQSGSVPFLDIDNQYILAGAQYDPQVLAGLSIGQIASRLRDPGSPVARTIDGSANVLIAAISQLLHIRPINGQNGGNLWPSRRRLRHQDQSQARRSLNRLRVAVVDESALLGKNDKRTSSS